MNEAERNCLADAIVWKDIPWTNGKYRVSSMGEILSLAGKDPRLLKPIVGERGYLYVHMLGKRHRINRIVLRTFDGEPPKDYEGAHLNGKRADNRLVNLRWVTQSENLSHKAAHGTLTFGEQVGNAVLTDQDVLRMKVLLFRRDRRKLSLDTIAAQFGCCRATVSLISRGARWKHIPFPSEDALTPHGDDHG